MKRLTLALVFAATAGQFPFAQSLEDIVAIGDKPACTVSDLSVMARAIVESVPDDSGLAERLDRELARFGPDLPLTKGRASLVAASGLRVRSSLFFMLIPTRRYAFRTMVVDGVFSSTSSGGDVMSGVELLDFITMVGKKYAVAP